MFMHPVARVDHIRLDALGEELRGARCTVTNDDHVDAHCLEVARRIDKGLALLHAGARRRDIDRIRRQSLLGELERYARSRRRLEEQIDDRGAAQRRHFLDRPFTDFFEWLRRVENERDLLTRQRLEAEQVLAEWIGGDAAHAESSRSLTTTASRWSSSSTRTSTRCVGPQSTRLPTMSG